jgi:hypothetical protein
MGIEVIVVSKRHRYSNLDTAVAFPQITVFPKCVPNKGKENVYQVVSRHI